MTQELRRSTGVERGRRVAIEVDGDQIVAYEGETIAVALLAAGRRVLHTTADHAPRGIYCNMGVCNSCLVIVDGEPNVRACMTLVTANIRVETQHGAGTSPLSLPEPGEEALR